MPVIEPATLTVYRDGRVNLNLEATRLMHEHHTDVDLLPPATRRQPWQLDRRAGACCQLGAGTGGQGASLRFRAPYRAAVLFAGYPPEVKRIRFRLTPHTQHLDLYTLAAEMPIATGHQNPAPNSSAA